MPTIPVTVRTDEQRPLAKLVYDVLPAPAAGQNIIFTCPPGYRYQLKSLSTTVVTDANVNDRNLFMQLSSPTGVPFYFRHPFVIINGETRGLCIAQGMPLIAHTVALFFATWPFPPDLTIEEGSTLTIGLTGIQVGDQFTATPSMMLSQFVAE